MIARVGQLRCGGHHKMRGESTAMLAQTWLFAELNPAERANLEATALLRDVPEGELLFRRDDPTPGLHLITAGAVKIYTLTSQGNERIIDIIGPGEFCGEMGVVDSAPSGAWGETLEPTQFWVIPPAEFERVLLTHPAIGLKLCRVLVGKLRNASLLLDETLFLSSRERVLRHLVRLAERHGRPTEGGLLVGLRLTHQEIAQLAGTARETVSRVLAELQDLRVLRFLGRQMLFADLTRLRIVAGLDQKEDRFG
jgi:CRP/FNR family cyclic AMP-dependent transcriptional regulator